MAINNIYVDTQGLTEQGNNFVKKSEEYKQIIKNVTKLTLSLCDVWRGTSNEKFVDRYSKAFPDLEVAAKSFNDIGAQLKDHAKNIENADNTAASKIRNSF